jgi:hypothetical protein
MHKHAAKQNVQRMERTKQSGPRYTGVDVAALYMTAKEE